jgi:O-antigen ligase
MSSPQTSSLVLVSSLLLGAVFGWAGLTKVISPERWRKALYAYRLAPGPRAVGLLLVPWAELAVLVAAVSGRARWGAWLSLLLLAIFSGTIVRTRIILGTDQLECACFGPASGRDYRLLLLRNALLAAIAVVVVLEGRIQDPILEPPAPVGGALVAALLVLAALWGTRQIRLRLQREGGVLVKLSPIARESLRRQSSQRIAWLLIVPGGLFLWWAGKTLALGGPRQGLVLGMAGLALGAPVAWALLARRVGPGALALEIPLLLLLFSTLVFRSRSADDLAVNPLDPAAQFRVAAVLIAGLLGLFALLSGRQIGARLTTLPFRLYILYALVVFAGAPLSVNPALTAYRGVELAAGLVVFLGARQSLGERAVPRIEATLYWFMAALVASVWIGVVAFPGEAIREATTSTIPLGFQIEGVYPSFAANGVGTLGVILTAWSLGRARSSPGHPRLRLPLAYAMALAGIGTLIVAQYRTGYVALAATLIVFLIVRRRIAHAVVLTGAVASILIAVPSILTEAQPVLLRGQTLERAQELSGRIEFWQNALPVWESSPLIGRGLLTATRFEVLAPLGFTFTSGIHGTWVEALVGTGLIGLGLLGSAYLISLWRAVSLSHRSGWVTPILLLTVLGVRSITGSTFESFSTGAIIFLWVALAVSDLPSRLPARSTQQVRASPETPIAQGKYPRSGISS